MCLCGENVDIVMEEAGIDRFSHLSHTLEQFLLLEPPENKDFEIIGSEMCYKIAVTGN